MLLCASEWGKWVVLVFGVTLWIATISLLIYYETEIIDMGHGSDAPYHGEGWHTWLVAANIGIVLTAVYLTWLARKYREVSSSEEKTKTLRLRFLVIYFIAAVLLYAAGIESLATLADVAPWPGSCGGGKPGAVRNQISNLDQLGAGPHRHMIVLNVTGIGGPANIPDDDKELAFMSLWRDGTLRGTRRIGLEMKGRSRKFKSTKYSYGLELWDDEDDGDADTIDEFGFTRKYEDYVIRTHRSLFVHPMAQFIAQPEYYEYTLVDLVIANGSTYTYEGVHFFVNNPAKRRSIQGSQKAKGDTPPSQATYIVEYESETDEECIKPNFECKYPKCKRPGDPKCKLLGNYSTYLRNALANHTHMDWPSLGRAFMWDQLVLTADMQLRSVLYHVFEGTLRAGPMWDMEQSSLAPGDATRKTWAVFTASRRLQWYREWLENPLFVREIAVNGSAYVDQYLNAMRDATAVVLAMDLTRELNRYPKTFGNRQCMRAQDGGAAVNVSSYVTQVMSTFEARAAWLKSHLPEPPAVRMKYTPWKEAGEPYYVAMGLAIAGATLGFMTAFTELCIMRV